MLTLSNKKDVKRVSEKTSYLIIGAIIAIGFIVFAIWGDLS